MLYLTDAEQKHFSAVEQAPERKGEPSMKPLGSALIAVACRISRPEGCEDAFRRLASFGRQVRRALASIKPLRNAWHFAIALYCQTQWRTYDQASYAKYIAANPDPWGYSSWSFGLTEQKIQTAIDMVSKLGRNFERALEIGCAQGAMTERLAPLCKELLAVDFVPVALERARARCRGTNVSFARWDLASDAVPGQFDLIVITDVLGSFGGRRHVRRARDKLVAALTQGGYLLYGDFIGDNLAQRIHDSWLGRLLLFRPGKILGIFAAHPALVQVSHRNTEMHLLALIQKRAATSQTAHYHIEKEFLRAN